MDTHPSPSGASRRDLLRGLAYGGLLLAVDLPLGRLAVAREDAPAVFAPDAFIRIAGDGAATLIMPQVEMGQGIYTALTMLIAEELDLPLAAVRLEAAPPSDALYGNPIFKVQATGGSTSVRAYWTPMRKAGAAARAMLVQAAAQRWQVASTACETQDGMVRHAASGRSLPYGELAAAASRMTPPSDPPLKDPKTFRLLGKTQTRLDIEAKGNGTAKYGIDAMPPGVKVATLSSCPVPGGKIRRVDDTQARAVAGVRQVVVLEDLVAVVGDHTWAAKKGLDKLVIEWDEGPNATLSTESLRAAMHEAAKQPGVPVKSEGADARPGDAGVISASYELPFLAHAPMEPMNCTVHLRPGACEIWIGTQVMTMAQAKAAQASGLKPDQIIIHNHLLGGGFGRRLEVDMVDKAVRIAAHVDGPVKVVWTREEDIQKAMYRSTYGSWLSARLENGKPVAWRHKVVGPAVIARWLPPAFSGGVDIDAIDGAADQPYAVGGFHVDYVRHEPQGVPTCFWRGVGPNNNIFSVESFIDRLAREAKSDPLDFRRALLTANPRALQVLNTAATQAGWGTPLAAKAGERVGRGICLQTVFGSFLSTIAEVAVDDDGTVRVRRLVTAVDCGMVVNPDGVISQIQGGLVFGLSAALHGRITFEKGRVQQSNFHDYRVVRIDEMPAVEVHLVPSTEAPGGIGEPGTTTVQPAVANAIYAATGVQLTRMPIDQTLLAKVGRT
ncbi:xanthine dehydrogenase family protein molybdopterin-binding subunit [Nitrospirillum sp. BR 11828]|uniref:xanthine dehydrogenase family protein molybdopterin-binding subunit n=1 Tax=Nitrospirillum sp. BR 11828 TaxID=3104325 RepID=UPI002ACA8F40|nr:xanthine dehydrogenase family protein molybdopterin-binding subunit [Nitrospirillum sp. BR 11828]MDZ5645772.1 xanthine dehydrogenase family protein molybdopterin-binding subunit [Nitrospirillum sp. BR 11828]